MGFREEFRATGSRLDPSLFPGQEDEFRPLTARQQLVRLQDAFRQSLEEGARRIAGQQVEDAEILEAELIYQAEHVSSQRLLTAGNEGQESGDQIAAALRKVSDYFGAALSELRWSVERQVAASERMLETMLASLDNTARQYFEQGVKCYEAGEYALARERFERALDADRTNYYAWQYLGLIAVAEDQADEAIRAFTLAHKFARDEEQQAQALLHLARSYQATNYDAMAADLARAATEACPDNPGCWYDLAAGSARLGLRKQALAALREAIERDWTWWGIVLNDPDFAPLRDDVTEMLGQLRERERERNSLLLDRLRYAIETARIAGASAELAECEQALGQMQQEQSQANIFIQRDLAPRIRHWHDQAMQSAAVALEERIQEKQQAIRKLHERAGKHAADLRQQEQMRDARALSRGKRRGRTMLRRMLFPLFCVLLIAAASSQNLYPPHIGLPAFLLLLTGGIATAGLSAFVIGRVPRGTDGAGRARDRTEDRRAAQQPDVDFDRPLKLLQDELYVLEEMLDRCRRGEYLQPAV